SLAFYHEIRWNLKFSRFCSISVAKYSAKYCATSWPVFTTIVPVTACRQGSYGETYSRSKSSSLPHYPLHQRGSGHMYRRQVQVRSVSSPSKLSSEAVSATSKS